MNSSTEQDYQRIIRQQQARIAELEQLVAQLTARVEELSAQVARLRKNSSNSSKPPSSDIVKPPKPPVLLRQTLHQAADLSVPLRQQPQQPVLGIMSIILAPHAIHYRTADGEQQSVLQAVNGYRHRLPPPPTRRGKALAYPFRVSPYPVRPGLQARDRAKLHCRARPPPDGAMPSQVKTPGEA